MDRYRSRVVKILGRYYLEEIVGDNLKKEFAKAFVEIDSIGSENELLEFIKQEGHSVFD